MAVEPIRLGQRAGESVQNEAAGSIRLGEAGSDHLVDQVVGNQLATLHYRVDLTAQFAVAGGSGAEQVASGDLGDSPKLYQFLGLRSLACAGCAEEQNRPRNKPCGMIIAASNGGDCRSHYQVFLPRMRPERGEKPS